MPMEWLVHELPTDQAEQVPQKIRVAASCPWFCLALMGFVLSQLLARGAATEGHADALLPMYKIYTCILCI